MMCFLITGDAGFISWVQVRFSVYRAATEGYLA